MKNKVLTDSVALAATGQVSTCNAPLLHVWADADIKGVLRHEEASQIDVMAMFIPLLIQICPRLAIVCSDICLDHLQVDQWPIPCHSPV
jgi:hypothetical protein